MEGLHHMSGELFLLIEPNAVLLSLKQHGIVDSCLFDGPQHPFDMFFPELPHNQLLLGLYLCC